MPQNAAGGAELRRKALRNGLIILGAVLFLSDMIHHFLVRWPVTGAPSSTSGTDTSIAIRTRQSLARGPPGLDAASGAR